MNVFRYNFLLRKKILYVNKFVELFFNCFILGMKIILIVYRFI